MGGLSPAYHHWSPEEGVSDFPPENLVLAIFNILFLQNNQYYLGNIEVRLGNELAVLVGCLDINSQHRLHCLRFPDKNLKDLKFHQDLSQERVSMGSDKGRL